MVLSDADTSVSGAAIIAAIIHILYKKKKGMRGTALTDALPTILMDTSTYDLTDVDPHATVNEKQYLLMSVGGTWGVEGSGANEDTFPSPVISALDAELTYLQKGMHRSTIPGTGHGVDLCAPGHDRLVSISAELQKFSYQIKRREETPSPGLSTVALMEKGEFKVPRLEEDLRGPWHFPLLRPHAILSTCGCFSLDGYMSIMSIWYLHLCLVPALVLCLKSRSEPSDAPEAEQGESMQEVAADSISRTAAGDLS
ncbi:hypothetical protein AK812_SmicGene13714 [Symbiodinium microadriaticum]|uniref:Uncharacterized protein n=1 Tax=Symbiodinium microadriaticum TaxID=2951 RepID=A0A1Q9E7H0_SYMMI|nr:hypothetical protein AK812_SmicGene13714 [Symbiodinium microadriaticum]